MTEHSELNDAVEKARLITERVYWTQEGDVPAHEDELVDGDLRTIVTALTEALARVKVQTEALGAFVARFKLYAGENGEMGGNHDRALLAQGLAALKGTDA